MRVRQAFFRASFLIDRTPRGILALHGCGCCFVGFGLDRTAGFTAKRFCGWRRFGQDQTLQAWVRCPKSVILTAPHRLFAARFCPSGTAQDDRNAVGDGFPDVPICLTFGSTGRQGCRPLQVVKYYRKPCSAWVRCQLILHGKTAPFLKTERQGLCFSVG